MKIMFFFISVRCSLNIINVKKYLALTSTNLFKYFYTRVSPKITTISEHQINNVEEL